MLLVLGDVGELPLGVDAADDAVDKAGVLHGGVAWKMQLFRIRSLGLLYFCAPSPLSTFKQNNAIGKTGHTDRIS